MEKHESAADFMHQGYSCSQSVVLAFASELGIAQDVLLRIASGFGGGMGRTGNVCGAVSGAVMVIGLKSGYSSPEDKAGKEKLYDMVAEFHKKFQEIYGAVDCPALLGYNLANPDDRQKARDAGLFKNRCPLFVQDAVKILSTIKTSS